jgi:transposase-like protein
VLERYQRSEKALVAALVKMYVQGVSTRKVKAVTEELCGHEFSASTISRFNEKLDAELEEFTQRPLEEEYPYLVLDARYEKVRENGVIRSQAVQVAIGINWDGRRCMLAVEMANRESHSSWKEFLLKLKQRGLQGVVMVVSDDHAGLKRAIQEVLPAAIWHASTSVYGPPGLPVPGLAQLGAPCSSFQSPKEHSVQPVLPEGSAHR